MHSSPFLRTAVNLCLSNQIRFELRIVPKVICNT